MDAGNQILAEMWQDFSRRYGIETYEVTSIEADSLILVKINWGTITHAFDSEKQLKAALKDREMEIKRQFDAVGSEVQLEIARLQR